MKHNIAFLFFIIPFLVIAQTPNGYWDTQRTTTKEVTLSAGDKIVLKSEEFPIGTTELAYRITLLDENQKMVNDLASVLKAIPDPYFIGKGTGGALSLVSSISGADKCTYAVFVNEKVAADYATTEKTDKACIYQNNPVSKDAKIVGLKSTCLDENTKHIWFAFKNQNWLMGEKIVLEIVPWVDNVASKGWTKNNKSKILSLLQKESLSKNLKKDKANDINLCHLDKIMDKYKYQDFINLSSDEQRYYVQKNEEQCFKEVISISLYYELICFEAYALAKSGKYDEGILLIESKVVSKPDATAKNYNTLGELYLQSNQLEKALQTFLKAEQMDSSDLIIKMNLAHTYMFKDEVSKSKAIHKKFMNQNVYAKQTWKNKAINDLDHFKKSQLPKENIDKIWRLFN